MRWTAVRLVGSSAVMLLLMCCAARAEPPKPTSPAGLERPIYPLETCVVSGRKLGSRGAIVDRLVQGRLVRLCEAGCAGRLNKEPASFLKKIDTAYKARQLAKYPLGICPISGSKLGSMGAPLDVLVGRRLVRLCCAGCAKALEEKKVAVLARIDAALIAAQLPTYASKTCPISGRVLGSLGKPVDVIFHTRLVRFCCQACPQRVAAHPAVGALGKTRPLAEVKPKPKADRSVLHVDGMS